MPIISPTMVSYADELNFNQLLEDLLRNKHNGFIRVTSGSYEGYILFKNGNQVAASYDKYSKLEAVESIKSIIKENNTLIEVFNLKESPVDYLISVNKPYLIESSNDVYDVLNELKKSDNIEIEDSNSYTETKSSKEKPESKSEITEETNTETTKFIQKPPNNEPKPTQKQTIQQINPSNEDKPEFTLEKESKIELTNSKVKLKQSNPSNTEKILIDESTDSKEPQSEEKIQTQTDAVQDIEKKSTIEEESIDSINSFKKIWN